MGGQQGPCQGPDEAVLRRSIPAPSHERATRVGVAVTLVLLGIMGAAILCCTAAWIAVALGLPVAPSP